MFFQQQKRILGGNLACNHVLILAVPLTLSRKHQYICKNKIHSLYALNLPNLYERHMVRNMKAETFMFALPAVTYLGKMVFSLRIRVCNKIVGNAPPSSCIGVHFSLRHLSLNITRQTVTYRPTFLCWSSPRNVIVLNK